MAPEAVGLGGGSRVEIELDPHFRELWDREKSQSSVTTHPPHPAPRAYQNLEA